MGYTNGFSKYKKRFGAKKSMGSYLRFLNKKPFGKYAKKTSQPKVSFNKRVNAIISKQVENKISSIHNYQAPVVESLGIQGQWAFFLRNAFYNDPYWHITQGTAQNSRVGNTIKLKKWIIKGQIVPATSLYQNTEAQWLNNSMMGYVTIYFGRRTDSQEITNDLGAFYQQGNTSAAPTGTSRDIMTPVNKDVYKVYYKRRFKMAPSSGQNSTSFILPNNDFELTKTFGFDVCKHIMKNATIKFNDASIYPNHQVLRDLAFWATWTPAVGLLGVSTIYPTSFYRIDYQAHIEYEDA